MFTVSSSNTEGHVWEPIGSLLGSLLTSATFGSMLTKTQHIPHRDRNTDDLTIHTKVSCARNTQTDKEGSTQSNPNGDICTANSAQTKRNLTLGWIALHEEATHCRQGLLLRVVQFVWYVLAARIRNGTQASTHLFCGHTHAHHAQLTRTPALVTPFSWESTFTYVQHQQHSRMNSK